MAWYTRAGTLVAITPALSGRGYTLRQVLRSVYTEHATVSEAERAARSV